MMSKFIEVHELNDIRYADTHLVSVNVDNITFFGDKTIFVPIPDDNGYYTINVTESYDEIKQLIKDAGVLIHKPDPRLNLTKPLTMDDLREMIGEPVWNSNNGKWYLMLKVRDDLDPELAVVQDSDAKIEVFSPEELIKFPLYRMNQEVK